MLLTIPVYSFRHYASRMLNISYKSNKKQIKTAYLELSKVYHPDNKHTGDQEKFIKIKEAYQFLIKEDEENSKQIIRSAPVSTHAEYIRQREATGDYMNEPQQSTKKTPIIDTKF